MQLGISHSAGSQGLLLHSVQSMHVNMSPAVGHMWRERTARLVAKNEGVKGLAKSVDNEAELAEVVMVKDVAAIKHEGRALHAIQHCLPVQCLELIPFCEHSDGVGALGSLEGALACDNLL